MKCKCKCKGLKPASIIGECTDTRMNADFIIKDLKEKVKNYKRIFN
jgi:hypothetical protein